MDEKSLIARANEERERLFQRYEHGREPGAEIDPWEDPGFEVYHQTDRYGFIHDKRLPQKIDQNEIKLRSIEMERVKKWLKMLKNWNSKETQEKLHKRIYKGVPDKLRSQVWMKLLNIEKIMSEKKDVYQNMLKLARQWSTEARQIDSDVNRQFREHLFYRERYSIKQRSLFNVLTAYSMYNMEVGYCQGMSGVAGVLLMYMDEEEAFWALSTLLADRKYAMHGLYIEGFPKLNRLVQHHDRIIEKFLPKLKKHFDLHNLDSMIYSLKWFFVIFIERIPFSLCLRVWDIYLLDGERVVTAMAYNILKLHQKKLLKLKDMDLLVQYLQTRLHKDFGYDDDYVIKIFEQSMEELRKSKMDYAPSPPESEFPQRPFGVFIEPTIETKIGRRKSSFTETEREVTENVIMRREKTQQELADSTISDGGLEGSNSQLNTGNIPESEDGGSLLGSSRKSLADTSITSTADLSVFSTGQRSQQFDDTKSMHSDADGGGESSPGSAFGSLSIVGRTPSAMMITPTPRAISPHDIVRIYVPPAPPDEIRSKSHTSSNPSTTSSPSNKFNTTGTGNKSTSTAGIASTMAITTKMSSTYNNDNEKMNISSSNNLNDDDDDVTMMISNTANAVTMTSSSSNHNNFYDNSNGSSSSKHNSIVSGEITPIRRSFICKSDEDFITTAPTNGGDSGNGDSVIKNTSSVHGANIASTSSSSSRRGSLSRKSPMSPVNIVDYEHVCNKKRSTSSTSVSTTVVATSTITHEQQQQMMMAFGHSNDEKNNATRKTKVMTSFEELAKLRKKQQEQQQQQQYVTTSMTTSDDDDFSPKINKKTKSSGDEKSTIMTSSETLSTKAKKMTINMDDGTESLLMKNYRKRSSTNRSSTSDDDAVDVFKSTTMETLYQQQYQQQQQQFEEEINCDSGDIGIGPSYGIEKFNNERIKKNIVRQQQQHQHQSYNENTEKNSVHEKMAMSSTTPYNFGNNKKLISNSKNTDSSSSSGNISNSNDKSGGNNVISSHSSSYTSSSTKITSNKQRHKDEGISSSPSLSVMTTIVATSPINPLASATLSSSSSPSATSSNIDFDRRVAASLGGPYDYKGHHSNTTAKDNMNKIRIKVQQKQ